MHETNKAIGDCPKIGCICHGCYTRWFPQLNTELWFWCCSKFVSICLLVHKILWRFGWSQLNILSFPVPGEWWFPSSGPGRRGCPSPGPSSCSCGPNSLSPAWLDASVSILWETAPLPGYFVWVVFTVSPLSVVLWVALTTVLSITSASGPGEMRLQDTDLLCQVPRSSNRVLCNLMNLS